MKFQDFLNRILDHIQAQKRIYITSKVCTINTYTAWRVLLLGHIRCLSGFYVCSAHPF